MMNRILGVTALFISLLAAVGGGVGRGDFAWRLWGELSVRAQAAQESRDFRWSGRLAAGQTVAVYGVNGEINAEATSGDQIEVTARKSGKRSNPDDVRVEVKEVEGGIIICAVYPARSGEEPNECGRRMNGYNNDVKVDFTLKIPAGINLKANNVNGDIQIAGLRGKVKANTVNGDVSVATAGEAEAATVNGDVDVTMDRSESNEPLKYSTVNGDIVIKLTGGIDASFSASTVNGDINSDFTLESYEGKYGPKSATGRIGNGGRKVKLSTVNGDIRLQNAAR
jgi:hypothetical protein